MVGTLARKEPGAEASKLAETNKLAELQTNKIAELQSSKLAELQTSKLA